MLLKIALNLSDQVSEDCLSIVNLILNTHCFAKIKEFEKCISYL